MTWHMKNWLCQSLLTCTLRALGINVHEVKIHSVRPLVGGGMIVVLEPVTPLIADQGTGGG